MAKTHLSGQFELQLKDKDQKADCVVSVVVDGKSLPTMAVLGEAMEEVIALFQAKISASYDEVPARPIPPATPAAKPLSSGTGNLLTRTLPKKV